MSLELRDLCVDIAGRRIVTGVGFTVPDRTFTGLLGPNGSGKSTILKAIYRVHRPAAGRVLIDGHDLLALRPRDAARRVAVVAQEFTLEFDFTVAELVMIGRTPHKRPFDRDDDTDRAITEQAMEKVGCQHLAQRGFNTLSGGEKQRVLIAQALAQGADHLILDEPTSHLDIRYQVEILELIASLGVTVLAAIHDLSLAALFCDTVQLIADGQLLTGGPPQQVPCFLAIGRAGHPPVARASTRPNTGDGQRDRPWAHRPGETGWEPVCVAPVMRNLLCDGVFAYWRVGEGAARWCKAWCGGAWRAALVRPPGKGHHWSGNIGVQCQGEPAGVASASGTGPWAGMLPLRSALTTPGARRRRSTTVRSLLRTAAVATMGVAALSVPFAAPVAAAGGPAFIHGVLPPPPAGSTSVFNQAAEPQIRADQAGHFYISSENGLGSGTDAWSSANGGTTYGPLPQPNEVSSTTGGTTGFAPGGGDTDLATAPVKNSAGTDNLYVASLTLGSVTVSLSQDGGHTWANDVTSATVPGDDREWIAAAGADGFYLSYHAIGTGDQIIVNQGQVAAGQPTTAQTYDAINPAQTNIYLGTVEDNEIGNIAVDPATGDVYQVFVGCPPSATAIATCASFNTAYMAVGVPATTGGVTTLTFTDYVIFSSPSAAAGFGNNFPAVAVDKAGNVYATWSDDQNVFLAFSTSHGQHWSKPKRVNHGTAATTAIFPWLAAGAAGKVDLVFYGTPAAANFQTCGQTGTYTCQNEPWSVFFAQNLNVPGGGTWAQATVTPVVHFGGVCQGGVSCTSNGNDNRDLFDDFGVAASPTTGLASITYSDDQFADNTGTANAGECTQAQNNTGSCDHTDFATQTSGHGIY